MAYRVRLSCRDCTGEDFQGCFDGGTELVTETAPPYDAKVFDTLEEARAAGNDSIRGVGPWEFDVEYADGDREGESVV